MLDKSLPKKIHMAWENSLANDQRLPGPAMPYTMIISTITRSRSSNGFRFTYRLPFLSCLRPFPAMDGSSNAKQPITLYSISGVQCYISGADKNLEPDNDFTSER
uniref:Uncharacterized protein n=1 Tax=Glossina austeni TaxID=7395 RepID=A0A1A9VF26_GLOAU